MSWVKDIQTTWDNLFPKPPPFLLFGLHSVEYTEVEHKLNKKKKRGRPGNEANPGKPLPQHI